MLERRFSLGRVKSSRAGGTSFFFPLLLRGAAAAVQKIFVDARAPPTLPTDPGEFREYSWSNIRCMFKQWRFGLTDRLDPPAFILYKWMSRGFAHSVIYNRPLISFPRPGPLGSFYRSFHSAPLSRRWWRTLRLWRSLWQQSVLTVRARWFSNINIRRLIGGMWITLFAGSMEKYCAWIL